MVRVAVNLVLIFVLLYTGVTLWYGRLEKKISASPRPSLPIAKSVVAEQPVANGENKDVHSVAPAPKPVDFQIIVRRNIFDAGLDGKALKKENVVEEKLEETKLQLALQGTVTGNDRDSRAIIVDEKDKKQDIYKVGDDVQGALITAIQRGKVILQVRGKKEVLLISERKGDNSGASGVRADRPRPKTLPQTTPQVRPVARVPVAIPHRRINFRQDVIEPSEPLEEEVLEETAGVEEISEQTEIQEENGSENGTVPQEETITE